MNLDPYSVKLVSIALPFNVELSEAIGIVKGFCVNNVPFNAHGFLYSETFKELTNFIFNLRLPNEEIVVVQDDLVEEELHVLSNLSTNLNVVRSAEDFDIITNVDEKLLNTLLKMAWNWQWSGETIWIAIGKYAAYDELAEIIPQGGIGLPLLVKLFPVVISRGHDAEYLELYSRRHTITDVEEVLRSVLSPKGIEVILEG